MVFIFEMKGRQRDERPTLTPLCGPTGGAIYGGSGKSIDNPGGTIGKIKCTLIKSQVPKTSGNSKLVDWTIGQFGLEMMFSRYFSPKKSFVSQGKNSQKIV